jgi:uncharacterized protein YjeT (DUF2065 family)
MISGTNQNGSTENRDTVKFFLCVLGMVLIIEGLPYFAFPEKIKGFLMKLRDMPDSGLRLWGLFATVTGLILVYFGRS